MAADPVRDHRYGQPTPELVREVLGHLADRVAARMRAKDRAGRTVTVRVRFAGMCSATRSLTLPAPIATTLTLTEVAEELAWHAIRERAEPRVRWAVDRSMDAVRARFGRDAVGYLPAALKRSGGVPDDFRELAEREL
ncbi:MAG TPA: hypothetical protein VI248_05810 [Kineosporiaceae bacterium]